jgi:HSP20 family protein
MTTETRVQRREASPENLAQTVSREEVYVPRVDIVEGKEDFLLTANMPGVDAASMSLHVEKSVLTIEGRTKIEAPPGLKPARQEFAGGSYRRTFELSSQIAVDGIKARMKDGVLRVTLPKREEAKARKIDIKAE